MYNEERLIELSMVSLEFAIFFVTFKKRWVSLHSTQPTRLYEVFKRILQQRSEDEALQAVAIMQQGQVVDLDVTLALSAAKTSTELKIPMADSIILVTARAYDATVWTQDEDFKGIDGVQYIKKITTGMM